MSIFSVKRKGDPEERRALFDLDGRDWRPAALAFRILEKVEAHAVLEVRLWDGRGWQQIGTAGIACMGTPPNESTPFSASALRADV